MTSQSNSQAQRPDQPDINPPNYGGQKIRFGPPFDDSHLEEGENAVSLRRTAESLRIAEQVEGSRIRSDDEADLRAELDEYYHLYLALERRRLRLIYAAQQMVLSEGKANVDPGSLVMILNLARMS